MSTLTELEKLLRQGEISRREFLSRTIALGLTAALPAGLLSESARAATPKRGGRFRIAAVGGSISDSMDPATLSDSMNILVSWQSRNCLVEVSPDGNAVPELAESWEPSSDAATWTFKLRPGVEFHNGKTLEAQDVIDSINHHRKEDSKSAAKGIVEAIKDIRADGKHTVVFELSSGNADFPFILSDYHLVIAPTATEGEAWENAIGTGGYVLKNWEPGVRAFATRNSNYWKDSRAHFDEIEILGIADVAARTNALKTGEVDAIDYADLKTIQLLEKTPGIRVIEASGTSHASVPMRTDTPPFNNNDVRLALKYAVDRQQLIDKILRGRGKLGNDHPIGRSNRFYADELPQREYDPDKAKFHLKKAGLSTLSIKLSAANAAFGGAVDAAVLYKEHAAKAGIKIEVVREPDDGYWSNVWMKRPWCMSHWSGRATEDWMFSTAYAEGASWNDSFWQHERFNRLLKEARAELDEGKRREMYVEMQRIVRDQGGVVVPYFDSYVMAAAEKVKFGEIAGNWDLDGLKAPERWWFA